MAANRPPAPVQADRSLCRVHISLLATSYSNACLRFGTGRLGEISGPGRHRGRPGTRRGAAGERCAERAEGRARRADVFPLRCLPEFVRLTGALARVSADCGRGRNATSILPMVCTGSAPSCAQSDCSSRLRSPRSSIAAWIFTSSWTVSARSSSRTTPSVGPPAAIQTTGFSACARARKVRRLRGVRGTGNAGSADASGGGGDLIMTAF